MDSRVGRDQEVDIKELLYGILKEWRLLLGVGCVCAAALGGYKAVKDLAVQMDPAYGAERAAEYEEALLLYKDEKKGLEREIEGILRDLNAQQGYLESSVLMKISPYEKGVATAKLYVRAKEQPQGQPTGEEIRQEPGNGLSGADGEAAGAPGESMEDGSAGVLAEGDGTERRGAPAEGDGTEAGVSADRTGRPDGSDGAGQPGGPDGTGQPGGSDGMEQLGGPDRTGQPGGSDGMEWLSGPGSTGQPGGPDGAAKAPILDMGQMEALVQAYASSFKEDGVLEQAAAESGLALRYVKELIDVEREGEGPVLTVTAIHQDEEAAKALLDSLLSAMEEKERWLGQEIGESQLVTVSETSDLVADQALKDLQEEEEARRAQLQDSLKAKREELDALTEPEPFRVSRRGAVLLGIRYGLFGGVLGVFLAGFAACLHWLSCDRAVSASEVEKRWGILELGTFGRERKGAFCKVDRLLELTFGIEPALEDEQVYQLIETRIKTFYPEAARIYVAGPGPDTGKGKLAVRLRKAFPDREIHMGGPVHQDPEALEGAAGCDGVILVAEKDRSTYQQIWREALAVENCRGQVLGCVLV